MNQINNKYGLICGLTYVIFALIGILTGLQTSGNTMLQLLFNAVLFGATLYIVFLAVKEFRDSEGSLTLGQGVKMGLTIGFFAALISVAFNLLYSQVIDPGYIDTLMAGIEESYEKRGMTDEQIEQAMKMTSWLRNPMLTAAIGIVAVVFWGIIKGLISGAILKREPEAAA